MSSKTHTVICRRCGQENENSREILEIKECPHCENMKFDREIFAKIEKHVIDNFKRAENSRFGATLKGLYVFGSYANEEQKCGDIDMLVTYSEPKLESFVRVEIDALYSKFWFVTPEEYTFSEIESIIEKSFWDFRTCQEYPDCLKCNGEYNCKLPDDDYHSDFHNYCLKKCKNRNKEPIPYCCFGECVFLEGEIRSKILEEMGDIMKKGKVEFQEISHNMKVKVLDLIWKRKRKDLEKEFKRQKKKKIFKLYKINPADGKKKRVRIE